MAGVGSSTGNDRTDFDLVGIGEHFVFRHEVVTADHQMRLDDEIEFAQQFLSALGAFDFDLALRVTEVNNHAAMIRLTGAGLQTRQREVVRSHSRVTREVSLIGRRGRRDSFGSS